MKLYLCKRASGTWVAVNEGLATIPPFEIVDGPYDAPHAREQAVERNRRKAPPWKKHYKNSEIPFNPVIFGPGMMPPNYTDEDSYL